jgi:hypothetical protein
MFALLLLFVSMGRLYRKMIQQPETRALLISAVLIVVVGVIFYTRVEKWSVLDAIYFCVVTLGTVGYGDITPTTELGRVFTIFYIIFGLAVIGGFFATLGQLIRPARFMEHEGPRDRIVRASTGLRRQAARRTGNRQERFGSPAAPDDAPIRSHRRHSLCPAADHLPGAHQLRPPRQRIMDTGW